MKVDAIKPGNLMQRELTKITEELAVLETEREDARLAYAVAAQRHRCEGSSRSDERELRDLWKIRDNLSQEIAKRRRRVRELRDQLVSPTPASQAVHDVPIPKALARAQTNLDAARALRDAAMRKLRETRHDDKRAQRNASEKLAECEAELTAARIAREQPMRAYSADVERALKAPSADAANRLQSAAESYLAALTDLRACAEHAPIISGQRLLGGVSSIDATGPRRVGPIIASILAWAEPDKAEDAA